MKDDMWDGVRDGDGVRPACTGCESVQACKFIERKIRYQSQLRTKFPERIVKVISIKIAT